MSALAELRRPLLALLSTLLLAGAVVVGIVGIVIPEKDAPAVQTEPTPGSALTKKLLLVVIDGLRHDVASDPARMPLLSRALRENVGGELLAGRVSMTTSAVLALGTGQRGSFEQIVRNVGPTPTPFDSWLSKAQRAGLTLMVAGDPAWNEMYPKAFARSRPDPKGVAIDVDFNPKTFRDARELRALGPDVLVVHFVTPDHQAHAHGVPSARYAEHVRGFERELFRFIDEMPRDFTIVVMGDHGAADSGTHGADVPIQRRTLVFARGPGIARGAQTAQPVDQVDLAGTFAALLGLPVPLHSRGHVLVEWLDTSPRERALLACRNADRAEKLRDALGLSAPRPEPLACDPSRPDEALELARRRVSRVDRALEAESGLRTPLVGYLALLYVALGVTTVLFALGLAALRGLPAALAVGMLGVLLTWGVERLPGASPGWVRTSLFVAGNVPLLLLLVTPAKVGQWLERTRALAPAVVPGLLVATYTTNAQPESFVVLVVSGLLLVLLGGLTPERPTFRHAARMLHPAHAALFVLGLSLLYFAGTRASDVYPAWLRTNEPLQLALAIALLALTSLALFARAKPLRWPAWALLVAIALGVALVLRRYVPPLPGRALVVASALSAGYLAIRDRRLHALIAALFTYCWISRDQEILTLAPTVLVADAAGAAYARHRVARGERRGPPRLADLLLCTAFLFGLAFVQRIGIQGAIDFGSMDFGAAAFGEVHVSPWTVGAGIAAKYALGLLLVLGAFASELGPSAAERVLCAAFVAFVARSVFLALTFLVAGDSFWTGLRLLGDLPMALVWSVAAGLAWLGARYVALPSSSS